MAKQDVTVELFYDSVWNDHTDDIYTRDNISITQGKTDAYSKAQPSSCQLTFDNNDGTFHPKNPNSSLFGKIVRNTPIRVGFGLVTEDFEDSELDITVTDGGDAAWARASDEANKGSWSFKSGSITHDEDSFAHIDVPAGATTMTFYRKVSSEENFDFFTVYLDLIEDEDLAVSGEVDWTRVSVDVRGLSLVTFGYEKDGSVSEGDDAAWIDDLSFDGARFLGEVSSWTPRRAIKGDAWTEVEAHGVSHRIGQGGIEPLSPLRDYVERVAGDVVAYWPMDSGVLADADKPVVGDHRFSLTAGNAKLGSASLAPWLPDGVRIEDGVTISGEVEMDEEPTSWTVGHVRVHTDGSRDLDLEILGNSETSGGSRIDWRISSDAANGNIEISIEFVSETTSSATLLDTVSADIFDEDLHHLRFEAAESGSDIDWELFIDGVSVSSGTETALDLQGVARVSFTSPTGTGSPSAFGHVIVRDAITGRANEVNASFGVAGQTATGRMTDAAAQYDGLDVVFTGDTDVLHVGPRYTEGMLEVIADAAAVDGGILADDITGRQLRYRTGRDLYNQDAALTLDWDSGEIAPPLEPDIDDLNTRNRVTVKRRNGQQFTTKDQDSIDEFGLVNANHTLNVFADGHALEAQAGWRLHLGTDESIRFPRVTVDLDASPDLADTVAGLDLGDRIDLVNLPDDISVDDVSLLAVGWTETIGSHRRLITFNCIPEAPYRIAELDADVVLATIGSDTATLNEDLNDSDGSVTLNLGAADIDGWDHEEDFDIFVGGERMTVTSTGVDSATFPNRTQTIFISRSQNGVTKAHSEGDAVSMADPVYIGL